jgi:hypothetical protein
MFLSVSVLAVAAQIACDTIDLDLRGDAGGDPFVEPEPPKTECEAAGHECIPPDRRRPGSNLCLDSSNPYDELECAIYDGMFAKALCCPMVELSVCELQNDVCLDNFLPGCPLDKYESREGTSCIADGRPGNKVCCSPVPCHIMGGWCSPWFDAFTPAQCPQYFAPADTVSCHEDSMTRETCCLPM